MTRNTVTSSKHVFLRPLISFVIALGVTCAGFGIVVECAGEQLINQNSVMAECNGGVVTEKDNPSPAQLGGCGPTVLLHSESGTTTRHQVDLANENEDVDVVSPHPVSEQPQVPFIRNSLARAVYMKMKEDEKNRLDRHSYWYHINISQLPSNLQKKFVQFEQDAKTEEFLTHCIDLSNELFTQLYHTVARTVLKLFMTQTSINGYLDRGSMFIFSPRHIETLLGISQYHQEDSLLDLGAGDGKVTRVLSPYFRKTYATEISSVMVNRLNSQGFTTLGLDEWQTNGQRYSLISCLNLLDRCDKPMKLLADIHSSLAPSGRLLLAVVIPFRPYVEFESESHQPTELLRVKGNSFEEEVEQFSHLFDQSGFELESFTRLPYLCEGDMHHSYYVLTDAVFVLRKQDNKT